jgi:VCBS repeat-containing protein
MDNKNITRHFYRDLKVWDANHKILPATMKMRDGRLVIDVNDKNAKYPITIDPLNKTADWTTSANGILPTLIGQLAVEAAYGFSVAGLGDVNGDGYADVGVGAPAVANVINGTGSIASVGAVFVYFGSANGLPTIPSAKLQPTTLVAGSLFGFSLAGGDITGDGRNDIIVGAPLDRVTISIGGGNTASGTVGKAYIFNGATLSTNTSPLLVVQSSGNGILRNGINLSVKALFGFSVAVTEDLNADNKRDFIIGAPTYAGIKSTILGDVLDVQSGGAFVYLTASNLNNISQVKLEPIKQDLLGLNILNSNINGLLFGYAVDGLGDYNSDGKADVVATAPAGVNAGLISPLLNSKLLQGSAIVYYGTGTNAGVNTNPGAVLTATSGGLLTNFFGTIANVANLFGVSVRGVRSANGVRNGNVLVGAPLGNDIINVLGLDLKTGTVSLFKKKASPPSAPNTIAPDQVLSSPRNSNNILSIIQANLLFGYSLDNALDVNCDGYGDIIVGEPASSGAQLINANVAGGAAYVYLGNASGGYQSSPVWTLTATVDAFLGVNATSLIGYSVAGGGKVKGNSYHSFVLVGSPSRTLDFGSGLLNLGNTLGTLFSLVAGNNGVGKAFLFDLKLCDYAPQAVNDVISTNEDTPVSGNVATNDSPSLDGGNTWTLVGSNGGASHGTVTMNPDGTYTYTPEPNYNGPDAFTYQLCDTDGDCSTATVNVTVTPVDDAPVAINDVNTTNEDNPVNGNVSTNDTTSPDCANTWSLVGVNGGALHGTVTMNPDGTYTYTPHANYNGTDVFTYQLCDCENDCSSATVTITVNPVDDVPVAVNDINSTNEDSPVNGNASTNDTPSGDCPNNNTWALVGPNGGALHGTVTMNANGTYTYTPFANYNGPDAFTYQLCDCDGDCVNASVNITVNPVDDLPLAVNDINSTSEDMPVSGNASTNDTPSGDGGNVWSLVNTNGGAANGTVIMNSNGTYTYTPNANFNGTDVFTYKLCDADGDCSNATVTITVSPVDDMPTAVNDVNSTTEDTPVSGNAATNDTPSGDGGNVWSLVNANGGALHGTVTMNPNGTYTYTPHANYSGSDVFTYKLCDADNDCSNATVTITISPVDDMPTAVNDVASTSEDTPVSGNAASNDTPSGDGGNTWSLVNPNGGATHGTVTMNPNGTYTYTPNANYNGQDVFTYQLCDTDGDCSNATVTITISPANDLPLAVNDVNSTNEDTPVSGNAASNDTPSGDGGNVWSLVNANGGAQHGTVTMNPNGTYTYTPHANYNGSDVFNYKLCDANGDCSNATVTITINTVDDMPTAVNDAATTNEDSPVSGNAATNDSPSGDCTPNIWSLVGANGGALHGTVTMNSNGTYTYTPFANYNGPDAFTYQLCDCDGDCSQATVNITVNPVDDFPVAVNDVNTTNQNTAVNGNAGANDTPSGDGGNVWSLVGANGGAQHGTVTMNANGTYTYTPAANYSGTDVFNYKLCDADGDCSNATVTITINSNCNLSFTASITHASCPGASNGAINITVSGANGNVTYLWNDGATTEDRTGLAAGSYYVTVTDAFGCSKTSATYAVNAVDATPPSITCPSNRTLVLGANCSASLPDHRGIATVSDNCTPTANITIIQSPAPGTTLNGTGATTVTLTATDASGNSSVCSFTVTRVDQTAPVITCPSNKTLVLGSTCSTTLPDYRGQATVSDNCTASGSISITQSPAAGTVLSGVGNTTVTLTATDASGNSSNCQFTVSRVDQTAPVLTCQPAKTIGCGATLSFDNPITSDNCSSVTLNIISTTSTDNGQSIIHTRTWQGIDASGNLSATCSQSVTQNKCSAHLFPTSTSCSTYKSGAEPLAQLCYAFQGGRVSNITPGVFFYYTYITAPSASFCIDIVQSNSCGFKLFSIQKDQIFFYNSSCNRIATGTQTSITGQGRVCVTNATPGAQYVLSVKYDSKSVQGSTFSGNAPICQYNFESRINNVTVDGTQGSINLVPNCNSSMITTRNTEETAKPEISADLLSATVFPNPSEDQFKLRVTTSSNEMINVRLSDISGRIVKQIRVTPHQLVQFGDELKNGLYIIEVRQGSKRVILKIEKL